MPIAIEDESQLKLKRQMGTVQNM